jgi:hypothetical protein
MDASDQNKVEKLFLIVTSKDADFQENPLYYYNPKNSKPVMPQIQNIENGKFIFFCDNTNESICKVLPGNSHFKSIQLDYGHMFLGHFKEVANIIANHVVD